MMRATAIVAGLLAANAAWGQWDGSAWPSALYPRRGAAHTTNTLHAYRERHCASQADFWSDVVWGPGADAYFGVGWQAQWTNYPETVWGLTEDMLYRQQRSNLIRLKTAITNALPWFVDIGRTNDFEAGSFTQYLQAHNRLPMLTLDRLQTLLYEKQGHVLAAGYWTNTPYRALNTSEYGWGPMTNIFALLVCTTGQVTWVEALACETTNTHTWGDVVTIETNWTASAAALGDICPPWDQWAGWVDSGARFPERYGVDGLTTCDGYFGSETNWPEWDVGNSPCVPSVPIADTAPSWSGFVSNNINFRQTALYEAGWTATAQQTGNETNSYITYLRGIAAKPAVTNVCAMIQRRADFYITGSYTSKWAGAGQWWKIGSAAETGNDAVVGPIFDPTDGIANEDIVNFGSGPNDEFWCCAGYTNEVQSTGESWLTLLECVSYDIVIAPLVSWMQTWGDCNGMLYALNPYGECEDHPDMQTIWVYELSYTGFEGAMVSDMKTERAWTVQRSAAAIWWDGPNGMKFK